MLFSVRIRFARCKVARCGACALDERPPPRAHPTAHVCLCGGVAQGSSSSDPLPGVGGVDLEAGEVRLLLPARRPRARGPHPLLAPYVCTYAGGGGAAPGRRGRLRGILRRQRRG